MDELIEQLILEYRDKARKPLNVKEVERIVDVIRAKINLHEDNITEGEYDEIMDGIY